MGFHEDHRNTVADRWAKKYRESGMTAKKFGEYMRKTMREYGWSEYDIAVMVEQALKGGE